MWKSDTYVQRSRIGTSMNEDASVLEWVRATRAAQGMPPVIENQASAARVLAAVDNMRGRQAA
ncbi:hypothetical protein J2S97_003446 [Arthrobacter oryzae]|nr:hypothetical protein [Arthrobacter oryzae]